jgi:hypothetical protein
MSKAMDDGDADRIERLANKIENASRQEGAALIDALSPEDRAALQAFVMQRAASTTEQEEMDPEAAKRLKWAREADLLEVLSNGLKLFDDLSTATPPTGMLAVVRLIVEDDPQAAIAALFAAAVLSADLAGEEKPPAVRELRDQWRDRQRGGS